MRRQMQAALYMYSRLRIKPGRLSLRRPKDGNNEQKTNPISIRVRIRTRMVESSHKSLGFDPGSSLWKVAILDDRSLISTQSLGTDRVSAEPESIRRLIDRHKKGLEAIAAPSGFGLPVTTVDKVGEREIRLMTLKKDETSIVGLTKVIEILKDVQDELGIRCFVLPSVKHLPTVPRWRKINRVDLGTSDKLCAAACALQAISQERLTSYGRTSFVLGEVGSSFVSMICVKEGKIVDGIGGTNAGFGTRASGALDAELAHIWSFPGKAGIYSGGLIDAAGMSPKEIERSLPDPKNPRMKLAITRFAECFASDAIAISSRNRVKLFILSSVLGPLVNNVLENAVRGVGLEPVKDLTGEISASIGAAYLANGLIGGRYQTLSESLGLLSAEGSVMEELFFSGNPMIP